MYDAIVVGGGIVGMSTAYHLVCAGAKTLLLDRADPGRATDAGAGIISAETNSRDPDAWFNFAVDATDYYPTLMARLQEEQSGDTGYARCGKLTVAVADDEQAPYVQALELILARQQRRGLPTPEALYRVTSDQAHALFPALAPVDSALYHRDAARVDGRLLNQALRQAALQRGLEIRQENVAQLIMQDRTVTGVTVGRDTVPAGAVAIAGGAWSRSFGAQLGIDIPLAPQRGQILHLRLPDVDTSTWPIISAFHGHYIVPWPDRRVVVGATREEDSGFRPHTTATGVLEVLSEALRVAPGLAGAEILEMRVGLRPVTTDTLPVLGRVPGVQGVWLATGHGPTGLTLGPYSGKVVADLMRGQTSTTDVCAFDVSRFA